MTTLDDLDSALSHTRMAHLARLVAAQSESWRHLLRFDPQQRWYHRLRAEEDHEVWLLSWLPGQWTGLHDHGGSAGAFVVAQGTLLEHTFAPHRQGLVSVAMTAGRVRSFGPRHVHDVVNASAVPSVSVHVYSPPLSVMNAYDLSGTDLIHLRAQRVAAAW